MANFSVWGKFRNNSWSASGTGLPHTENKCFKWALCESSFMNSQLLKWFTFGGRSKLEQIENHATHNSGLKYALLDFKPRTKAQWCRFAQVQRIEASLFTFTRLTEAHHEMRRSRLRFPWKSDVVLIRRMMREFNCYPSIECRKNEVGEVVDWVIGKRKPDFALPTLKWDVSSEFSRVILRCIILDGFRPLSFSLSGGSDIVAGLVSPCPNVDWIHESVPLG
jgi:hypothetical protein